MPIEAFGHLIEGSYLARQIIEHLRLALLAG